MDTQQDMIAQEYTQREALVIVEKPHQMLQEVKAGKQGEAVSTVQLYDSCIRQTAGVIN